MYSIGAYGDMIFDKVRMDAYGQALRQAVKPGAVVIDIGTGTGVFALLACRFGARRVYAIEAGDAIQVAREIAVANGYADRIDFIQAMSTKVTLPERADVLVSDLGDVLPWFKQHIPSIADARRRLLAPGAVVIPQRDTSWAAVVAIRDLYEQWTGAWDNNGLGFDMDAARRLVVNTLHYGRVTRDHLLTEPQRWATLDFSIVENPDVSARVTLAVTRPGTAHGLAVGFDRTIADGVYMSNAPDVPDATRPVIYRPVLFPWPTPVALDAGDVVTVDLAARLVHRDYIWNWKTRIVGQGASGAEKGHFSQSTFFGSPMSHATMQKKAASHTPALSEDGRIARFVLASMNDGASLGEIARLVSTEFSARFPRSEDALNHVADLSRLYC